MMFLGKPGQMIGIKCPTQQQVTPGSRYSFSTTLGGVVKAQHAPPSRRSWDVSLGQLSTPSDVGVLMEFADGAWGPGPFWFVSADAPVVNLLSPAAASCDPHKVSVVGGELRGSPPFKLSDGSTTARSVWKTSEGVAIIGDRVPVIPDTPVTGSAWVSGSGNLRLVFRNAAGGQIGLVNAAPPTQDAGRAHATATPPAEAVTVELQTTAGITQIGRPAITWTEQPFEWGDGQGCPQAVVHSPSRDVVKAWDNPTTGRWSNLSFVVQEIG